MKHVQKAEKNCTAPCLGVRSSQFGDFRVMVSGSTQTHEALHTSGAHSVCR